MITTIALYFISFYGQVAWWLELTQLNCGEVECPGFEPWPLHIICNIPINRAKLTGIALYFISKKSGRGKVHL